MADEKPGAQGNTESAGKGTETVAGGTGTKTEPKTETKVDEKKTGDAGTKPGEGDAGDKKPAEGTKADEGKKGESTTPTGPPDKYELTLPDGGRLDERDLKQFETLARSNKWSNDDAQAALDLEDDFLKQRAETLLVETKADKDYGGEKLVESQRLARAVIDRVRPDGHARRDSFIRFLNKGGDGNHIEVVSFLADLGRMMGEDSKAAGGAGGSGTKKTAEEILYPTSPKT